MIVALTGALVGLALAGMAGGVVCARLWRQRATLRLTLIARDALVQRLTADATDLRAVAQRMVGERDAAHHAATVYARKWTDATSQIEALMAADRARLQAEADARAVADRQATQRATDLDFYRAYLLEQMPTVCQRAGLDPSLINPAWDLAATGKLNDVVHHLSILDQRGHPLRTLADVLAVFVEAA